MKVKRTWLQGKDVSTEGIYVSEGKPNIIIWITGSKKKDIDKEKGFQAWAELSQKEALDFAIQFLSKVRDTIREDVK